MKRKGLFGMLALTLLLASTAMKASASLVGQYTYFPDGTLVLDYQDQYGDYCSIVVNPDGSSFTTCS